MEVPMRTGQHTTKRWIGVIAILFMTLLFAQKVQAQQINVVMEISWYAYGINYNGLMVTYTDNTGDFVVNYYLPNVGYIQVFQDVRIRNQYDSWGNCTSYLYCYDPVSDPPIAYSPDNFVIYPNGNMYTQDDNGVWSTTITARVVPSSQWRTTLRKYGIN